MRKYARISMKLP